MNQTSSIVPSSNTRSQLRDQIATPSVVIVVVNFRTPEETIACVESLKTLRYGNMRIVVVENASGDDSAEILKSGLPEDVTLFLAEENGGYTAGNNVGMRHALEGGADYVHVINPDTLVLNPDYLTELVEFLEMNPEVGLVGPRVYLRSKEKVQNTVLRYPWLWRRVVDFVRSRFVKSRLRSGNEPIEAEVLNGVCILMRSDCLRDVGLFDDRTFAYIEDIEWSYRAQRKGWGRVYLPVDSILHLQKEGGYERGSKVEFLLKRNTLYFLLKSRHWFQAAGYTLATTALAASQVVMKAARRRPVGPSLHWAAGLSRSYWGLWTARWDDAMGRPRF